MKVASRGKQKFKCKGIFIAPQIGWEWYVITDHGNRTMFGYVQSPLCPEGEFGDFSLDDVQGCNAHFFGENEVFTPPVGWDWKE